MFPWSFAQEIQDEYERALAAAPELLQRLAFVTMMMVVNHMNLSSIPWSAAADLRDLRSNARAEKAWLTLSCLCRHCWFGGPEVHIASAICQSAAAKLDLLWNLTKSLLMVSDGHARGGSKLKAPVSTSVQSRVTLYLGPLPLRTATKQNALDCVCALTRLRGQ